MFRDSEQLRRIIDAYANVDPAILQGRAYEFLEVLKFNLPPQLLKPSSNGDTFQ